jgi:hypothetical protein
MSKRLTREQRAYQKRRTFYLLQVVLLIALIAYVLTSTSRSTSGDEVSPIEEEAVVVQMIPEPVLHDEVEAVSMEYDPVRDDVPLDAEIQRLLYRACGETGIRYELALAVIWQETDFRNVVGDGGESFGYMQVQKKHHEERMERLGVTDLNDPYSNFLIGCDYLAELVAKDNGLEWALHGYNGGPTYANDMAKARTVSQYAKNVLNYMNVLTAR